MIDSIEEVNKSLIEEQDPLLEEKKRKLHPRPDGDNPEEVENPLDSKKRKLTNLKDCDAPTTDEHSSHEEESTNKKEEKIFRTAEKKHVVILSKSGKKIVRSKSRSHIKSKSKSKSKPKSISKKALQESVKKSESKLKEKYISESPYCLRPRKNIDYSKLSAEQESNADNLISDTGKPDDYPSDSSDVSFKPENSEKSSKNSKNSMSSKKDATSTSEQEQENLINNSSFAAVENKGAKTSLIIPEEEKDSKVEEGRVMKETYPIDGKVDVNLEKIPEESEETKNAEVLDLKQEKIECLQLQEELPEESRSLSGKFF